MSFLAAILLLNMDASDAFICLANLLNNDYLMACFRMDQLKINRYFKLHQILFQFNMPKLFDHFEEQKVKPDLYLIDWVFTLFSRSLPLDVVSRVWDVYLRDKEEFLFGASLGLLNLYKDDLLQMDFINIVKFLNKLPEDINSTKLFKSIEQMKTSIDNENSFNHLLSTITM
jgi:TBC1 domain family member 14